jgi:3-hydroxyacyl-CoA dehydrogenase
MTTGKHVPASAALELGIIDAIVEDRIAGAVAFLRQAIAERRSFTPVIERTDRIRNVDPAVFEGARAVAAKKQRGRIAPLAIIDCSAAACTLPAGEGLLFEKAEFTKLYVMSRDAALRTPAAGAGRPGC